MTNSIQFIEIGTIVMPIINKGRCFINGAYKVAEIKNNKIKLVNTNETIWIDKREYYQNWEEVYE